MIDSSHDSPGCNPALRLLLYLSTRVSLEFPAAGFRQPVRFPRGRSHPLATVREQSIVKMNL